MNYSIVCLLVLYFSRKLKKITYSFLFFSVLSLGLILILFPKIISHTLFSGEYSVCVSNSTVKAKIYARCQQNDLYYPRHMTNPWIQKFSLAKTASAIFLLPFFFFFNSRKLFSSWASNFVDGRVSGTCYLFKCQNTARAHLLFFLLLFLSLFLPLQVVWGVGILHGVQ